MNNRQTEPGSGFPNWDLADCRGVFKKRDVQEDNPRERAEREYGKNISERWRIS
jgi:hypothetical protein